MQWRIDIELSTVRSPRIDGAVLRPGTTALSLLVSAPSLSPSPFLVPLPPRTHSYVIVFVFGGAPSTSGKLLPNSSSEGYFSGVHKDRVCPSKLPFYHRTSLILSFILFILSQRKTEACLAAVRRITQARGKIFNLVNGYDTISCAELALKDARFAGFQGILSPISLTHVSSSSPSSFTLELRNNQNIKLEKKSKKNKATVGFDPPPLTSREAKKDISNSI